MNKEIDLRRLDDALFETLPNIPVPLEEYANILTKYELLRLDKNFTPFHITKGCLSRKRITKLLDLLIKKNKSVKSLNLSGCRLDLEDIKKLGNFKNLRSLNLHKTMEYNEATGEEDPFNDEMNTFINLNLNLKLLDISNSYLSSTPTELSNMESLEILSMENCEFKQRRRANAEEEMFLYSKLNNLRELDISENIIYIEEFEEISKLKKLKLLYCSDIQIVDFNGFNNNYRYESDIEEFGILTAVNNFLSKILTNIIKIKTLEYLDFSFVTINDDILTIDIVDSRHNLELKPIILNIIEILTNNLPKLKKLRCVFPDNRYHLFTLGLLGGSDSHPINYNTREITEVINGVEVTTNRILFN